MPAIVKLVALVAVPPAVVIAMGPVVAPTGGVAVIWVAESTVKLALVPLNRTAVAPVKFLPVIVTTVPTPPIVGEKPVMVGIGGGVTVTHGATSRFVWTVSYDHPSGWMR